MSGQLVLHAGAQRVEREQLFRVPVPRPTKTWYPIGHGVVMAKVEESMKSAGFNVGVAEYSLTRNGSRMFSVLNLTSPLARGVCLAVGVRNSIDKSLPQGFCAGSRVFVCDNLAFSSELTVKKKHTRFGLRHFEEAVSMAVQSLPQFVEAESGRLKQLQERELTDRDAESLMLRAYEKDIASNNILPTVIKEWREPSHPEFKPRTAWSLYNAFTEALKPRALTNPQQHAALTMNLAGLFGLAV